MKKALIFVILLLGFAAVLSPLYVMAGVSVGGDDSKSRAMPKPPPIKSVEISSSPVSSPENTLQVTPEAPTVTITVPGPVIYKGPPESPPITVQPDSPVSKPVPKKPNFTLTYIFGGFLAIIVICLGYLSLKKLSEIARRDF